MSEQEPDPCWCWLIKARAWERIVEPIAAPDGVDWEHSVKDAGYAKALTQGPQRDPWHEFSLEVWAGGKQSPYPYMCFLNVALSRVEAIYCAGLPDLLWLCGQIAPLLRQHPMATYDVGNYVVNYHNIAYVEREGKGTCVVHFVGGREPLMLRNSDAIEFWDVSVDLSNYHTL
jgi:hypothetical protein